ncbi:MAG: LysR family transcriptional regulator [Eggerthellaceae bacterium]|nr:LysR family transcriptional regulator [Eggerthellaceae bacterium]
MDTARYRAFVEAVDKGSLSQAAKTLNYTPSGVSQLISALERDLGFPLLERTKHGVRLTKTGETLLPVVRAIVQEEERLKEMSSEINGLTIGSVTIGSYPSVATHWLPKVIKAFHEHYPKIEIRVMEGIHQEIDDWLSTYQVDLAFMSQAPNSPYEWIPLGTDSMVAVLSLDHPLANAEFYPIERVEEEAFIMPGLGHDIDTMHVLEKYDLKPHVVIETIENASMLAMVEQGMGMSVVNSLLTKKLNFDIALVPIQPENSIIFGLAIQSLQDASPAVRRFVEYAIDQLNQLS